MPNCDFHTFSGWALRRRKCQRTTRSRNLWRHWVFFRLLRRNHGAVIWWASLGSSLHRLVTLLSRLLGRASRLLRDLLLQQHLPLLPSLQLPRRLPKALKRSHLQLLSLPSQLFPRSQLFLQSQRMLMHLQLGLWPSTVQLIELPMPGWRVAWGLWPKAHAQTCRSYGMEHGRTGVISHLLPIVIFVKKHKFYSHFQWSPYRVVTSKSNFQEKQELLAKWVQNQENLDAVECSLQLERKQQGELEHGRELLTVEEMKKRGFSVTFGLCFIFVLYNKDFVFLSKHFSCTRIPYAWFYTCIPGPRLRTSSKSLEWLTRMRRTMQHRPGGGVTSVANTLAVKPLRWQWQPRPTWLPMLMRFQLWWATRMAPTLVACWHWPMVHLAHPAMAAVHSRRTHLCRPWWDCSAPRRRPRVRPRVRPRRRRTHLQPMLQLQRSNESSIVLGPRIIFYGVLVFLFFHFFAPPKRKKQHNILKIKPWKCEAKTWRRNMAIAQALQWIFPRTMRSGRSSPRARLRLRTCWTCYFSARIHTTFENFMLDSACTDTSFKYPNKKHSYTEVDFYTHIYFHEYMI